jgi:methylmalonyl-CoA/ethylmalonyl-CoA epimerase
MPTLSLHHVGIAVVDVPAAVARYAREFGYEVKSDVIHDAFQTAYVQFLRLPGDSVFLEFVAPDGERSKLAAAVGKGGGLNHLCYGTPDIEGACISLRRSGLFLLQSPVAAAAFPGRRIAWLMGADRVPVELVETDSPGEL